MDELELTIKAREKLYYDLLERYNDLIPKDERYIKSYNNLKKNKDKYMSGWTFIQCVRNKKEVRNDNIS